MSEIALKIRFVLLGGTIVMQILEQSNKDLGYDGASTFRSSDDFIIELECDGGKTAIGEGIIFLSFDVPPQTSYCLGVKFDRIKQALSEFAENNAFHGKDKPVPRIEKVDEKHVKLVCDERGTSHLLSIIELNVWKALFKSEVGFYKDKPKFTHEWKKVYPREFTEKDLPMSIYFVPTERQDEAKKKILKCINESASEELTEIWEFEMRTT